MTDSADNHRRSGVSRRRFLQGAAGGAAYLAGGSLIGRVVQAQAQAGTGNVIVSENANPGTRDFQISFPPGFNRPVVGFAAQTSVNRGEPVPLKLISYRPADTPATIEVFRLGYYGGDGSRLVHTEQVPRLPNFDDQSDGERQDNFGLRRFQDWTAFQNVPGAATGVSGVYLVKVSAPGATAGDPPDETHIPFVVRDDARARDVLVVMPTNTWQAYNSWPPPGKSLYSFNSNSVETVAGVNQQGQSRAVKVSFDRPYTNIEREFNWVLRTEFPLIWWLEQQGYDLAYTDDYGMHTQPEQLRRPQTKTLAIAGHGEYWTKEMFDNVEAARDAGTNVASFSANAAYWQVRYEDAGRTLVCFKTVGGRDAASGGDAGADGVNDFGPGAAARGGADDPLGADGQAGGTGADADRPALATTTFRDPGAAVGAAGAPDGTAPRQFEGRGRVGPNRPESSLLGVLYIGDDDAVSYPLEVPAGTGDGGEFSAHRAWRHTTLANGAGDVIGRDLVGWEWDAIPRGGAYAQYAGRQPAGVKRLASSDPSANPPPPAGNDLEYLRDAGRVYSASPDPGQGPAVDSVTYRHPSGALVFAAGTMQWSWGLGPHFEATDTGLSYADPRVDSFSLCNGVIAQATYNILADGGVQPATPRGIVLDTESGTGSPPGSGPPRPNPRDTAPPKLAIAGGSRSLRRGNKVLVRVSSARSDSGGAKGLLTLVALVPRRSRTGRRLKPRRVPIGSRSFELRRGQSRRLEVKLTTRGVRLMRRVRSITVVAEAQAHDTVGNNGLTRRRFRLAGLPRAAARRRQP